MSSSVADVGLLAFGSFFTFSNEDDSGNDPEATGQSEGDSE